LPDFIDVQISDDECEDIELSLNDRFLNTMDKLVQAFEKTSFDMGEVKVVESII
jgi:hypothetical protein